MSPVRIGIILLAAIATSTPAGAESYAQQIRALCATEWAGDYVMQEYCIGRHREGMLRVRDIAIANKDNAEIMTLIRHCQAEWRAAHGYDWIMVAYYLEQQVES